ncbi:Por secretion system C-terminal sorting domain-containing protein [Pustulibacterium marinum]|uniref:Por secretion system C-terminal sorting domain-containing protein n=1 Tax=Pustulibacterium marinum TaxID=1224947 RepID=A0A1I7EW15_9FLAO|nr:T9SS type A sorting domain-containing protein [Pustulibacterium marinum]SFU28075.1 Por secretion system C-terminal sorting domain-containing protein [Pustulibacterium marinum]
MKKLLLVVLFVLAGTAVNLHAQSTYYVKQDATGTADGSSWANAYTTLQQAEDNAPDGADIWVAAGTYIGDAYNRGVRILEISNSHNWYGGFSGSETQLSQRNPETNVTIISGDALGNGSADAAAVADNAYHLVCVNATADILFDGITFEEAHANGGGINAKGGVLLFRGVDNSVELNNNVVFNNCTIEKNYANNDALYYIQESMYYYASVDLQFNACRIVNNRSYYLFQEIYDSWDNSYASYDTKHIYFTSCLIAENTSSTRGIFELDLALPCDIRFINNTIVNNSFSTYYDLITCDWGTMSTFQNSVQLYNNIISIPLNSSLINNETAIPNNANTIGNHMYFDANNESNSSIFEDYDNGDYHLAANSPAISAASNAYLLTNMSTDADNNPREISSLDIGAYEYLSCDLDNLEATSGNATSLTVSWEANTSISGPYSLTIVEAGESIANGTTITGVTSSPYTFTGLEQNTTYNIYIEYSCSDLTTTTNNMVQGTTAAFIYVDANATGANDGSSWTDAYTTLDAALTAVSGNNNTVLYVAKGTYTPDATSTTVPFTIASDNLRIYGGFEGTETSLSDRDDSLVFTTNATIISGDLSGNDTTGDFTTNRVDNSARLIELNADNVTLNGLVFSGGHANGSNNPVINTASAITSLTLQYCKITDNYATGVFIDWRNFTESIEMENVLIDGNKTTNGVVLFQSSNTNDITVSLANIQFTNNTYNADWGAIWFRRGNTSKIHTTISNGTFADNLNMYSSSNDYNLITQSSSAAADNILIIRNSIFWNNQYTNGSSVVTSTTAVSNPKSNEGNSQQFTVSNSIISLTNTNFTANTSDITSNNPNLDAAYMPTSASADVIDMGLNSYNTTTQDLAGNSRISNTTIDLGAYEYNAAPADVNAPTLAVQNITAYLDANGQVSITAQDIDNGTTDNTTATADLTLALDITSFDCSNVGTNSVTFSATDEAGNTDSTTATVTVVDNSLPTVTTQDITLDLGTDTSVTITPQDVIVTATDNCSVSNMTLDTDTFTTIGVYTVTVTVTDANNNQTIVSAIVTVEDTMSTVSEELETLKLYPNPASTFFTVKGNLILEQIQLFNTQGQLLLTTSENKVDVSNLSSGIYMVQITSEGKSVTKKLLLK